MPGVLKNNMNLKTRFLLSFLLIPSGNIIAQNDKLKIVGAYNYGTSPKKDIRVIAIVVKGNVNNIGDPDDVNFIDVETGKNLGYGVDDFSFLSPDGKEAWINLPKDFNRKWFMLFLLLGFLRT